MYKVIESFTDLQDNNFLYNVGDTFPRKDMEVSEERFAELASTSNRRRIQLIEKVEKPAEEKKPKKKKKEK